MKEQIIEQLRKMQFTEYEAKAYLALLEEAPLTGYGVSLHSGVPRSKIYEVLGNMVSRGDIMMSQSETPQYTPLLPEELIAQRKEQSTKIYEEAEKSLSQFRSEKDSREYIWNVSGEDTILAKVREILKDAHDRVLMELWSEEAETLREDIRAAAKRGATIQIIAYGELEDYDFAQVFIHELSEIITDEFGGRWVVCSVDGKEVVAGIVSIGDQSRAAWTTHPGLVMPISEVVIHDLYLQEILKYFRPELEEKFGPDLIRLREKYSNTGVGKQYFGDSSS